MSDIFDREKRSWLMAQVKGRDTKPELLVRTMLHRLGYRFTVNAPNNRKLPGKPDIVLPKWGAVIFVNGCFWHYHQGCKHARIPATRREFWQAKLERNVAKDKKNGESLRGLGWNVIVIWTCELETVEARETLVKKLPFLIERRPVSYDFEEDDLPMVAED